MPLSECMHRHTHREYRTWQVWLDQQWNEPSRTDNYLMQIAQEIRRVLHKHPERVKLDLFKILFEWRKRSVQPKITKEEATKRSKARWLGFLGMGVKRRGN